MAHYVHAMKNISAHEKVNASGGVGLSAEMDHVLQETILTY